MPLKYTQKEEVVEKIEIDESVLAGFEVNVDIQNSMNGSVVSHFALCAIEKVDSGNKDEEGNTIYADKRNVLKRVNNAESFAEVASTHAAKFMQVHTLLKEILLERAVEKGKIPQGTLE